MNRVRIGKIILAGFLFLAAAEILAAVYNMGYSNRQLDEVRFTQTSLSASVTALPITETAEAVFETANAPYLNTVGAVVTMSLTASGYETRIPTSTPTATRTPSSQ